MHNNNEQFHMVRDHVEKIMSRYRICKFNLSETFNLFNDSRKDLKECKTYVDSIDFILADISKEHAKLIRDVTLRDRAIGDLGYSLSTYYDKFRRAANSFLRYFE